tara:strand:- start:261 stop:656 length:396 start_codon:yes stop_codon:yes gene_type:complete
MSTLKTGTIQNSTGSGAPVFKNNSGTEIGQLVKVWVNFNGTGTIAIRDDFNVASLTDNGTGDYTINFTNAMSDTNYAVALSCSSDESGGSGNRRISSPRTKATNSQRISCNAISNNDAKDTVQTNMVIFGA